MLEKLNPFKKPSGNESAKSTETVNKLVKTNQSALLNLVAVAAIATGCGGTAFEQTDQKYDGGTDSTTDSADAQTEDVNETSTETGADAEQDSNNDAPDVNPNDGGCNGTEITLKDMNGYELLHTSSSCDVVKLDTTDNALLEAGETSLCLKKGDKLVVVSYDEDNNFSGTSTTPFDPKSVTRGSVHMEYTKLTPYFMHSACKDEIQNTGTCTVLEVEDQNADPLEFNYPGQSNCVGSSDPLKTGNVFFVQMPH